MLLYLLRRPGIQEIYLISVLLISVLLLFPYEHVNLLCFYRCTYLILPSGINAGWKHEAYEETYAGADHWVPLLYSLPLPPPGSTVPVIDQPGCSANFPPTPVSHDWASGEWKPNGPHLSKLIYSRCIARQNHPIAC